jgi:glutamate/aspartate transport system substrate-binding protein
MHAGLLQIALVIVVFESYSDSGRKASSPGHRSMRRKAAGSPTARASRLPALPMPPPVERFPLTPAGSGRHVGVSQATRGLADRVVLPRHGGVSGQAAVSCGYIARGRHPDRLRRNRSQQETHVKRLASMAIGCAITLLPALASAQALTGTLAKIRDTGTITIGHREASIPFSYLDDKQQAVGYAMDICARVVDAVKAELKMPNLKVVLQPVTSANRIPLLQNGSIDLECGSTTNSVERQKQVAFGPTYFVINVTAAVRKSSPIRTLADLNGRTISTTAGTTSVPLLKKYEKTGGIDVKEIYGKDHSESFLLLADDRVAAFVMDDVLLAGQIANARNPGDFRILEESLRTEPYSVMLRRDDAPFKALVDRTIGGLMKSGEIEKLYTKWFMSPIPPRNVNLNFPVSPALRDAFRNPNDRGVQ